MPALAVDGADIDHDWTPGTADSLVLVHGGMCDRRDWGRLMPHLGEASVLRIDLRAHGRSSGLASQITIPQMAADVNAVMGRLGLSRVVLVGHSLGARVVAEAVAQAPDDVAGLVLLDGSRSHGGLAATIATAPMPMRLAAVLNATLGPYLDDSARARVMETMQRAPTDVMAACVDAMRHWDLERADTVYPALACPVLAIQSSYHDAFTPRHSFDCREETSPFLAMLRRSVPDLAVEVLPHAGHFLQLEQPEVVARLITVFTKRVRKSA